MSYGCHRKQRAEEFRKHNYVSHTSKNRLRGRDATEFISKLESYFQRMAEEAPGAVEPGRKLSFRVKGQTVEYHVEMTGNASQGSIVLTGGYSEYSEIHFTPRAIHLYKSKQDIGIYNNESAVYLNRRLPNQSLSYGSRLEITRLMKNY